MAIPPPPGPQQPQDPQGPYPPPQGPGQPYAGPGQPYVGQGQPYVGPGPGQPYSVGPGQPPYGYPYQPWGQGYSPYNRPAPVNGFAIAALVLGILCCLPFVGLVFGIVALAQIRKKGERGKGMAVSGIVLSSIGTLLMIVSLATGGARDFWEGFQEAARENGGTFSVEKGECFDAPNGSLEGYATDVDTVPCSGEHDAEVFANVRLPEGGYPGTDGLTETADKKCYHLADSYAMDSWALPEYVDVYYFTPTRQSWAAGDREVTCMFGSTDEKTKLTGSLREDDSMLTADQLTYLQAEGMYDDALDTAPADEYVEGDLPGHKKWASRVAKALDEQVAMLGEHRWGDGTEQPVAGHADALKRAREQWERAAKAADANAFYEHYDKALDIADGPTAITARKALGLATTPPSYGEESGGDTGGGGDSAKEV
ncbi:DUF4190 domain-containing protein [Streptomyces sp. NPDC046862]|uniref:DUF4190 domain-containing protein n=1 Tax=Streptomyces sp. NPDC046862 TaxID=3154603 RepID=UPI0034541A7D